MNVLLADQHSHTRLGLEMLLNREPGVSIVGSAANSAGLLALARTAAPDLIILEAALPGPPPAELIAQLRRNAPKVQIILLCNETVEDISLSAGEHFCIKKGYPPAVLLALFRALRKNAAALEENHHLPRR